MLKIICSVHSAEQITVSAIGSEQIQFMLITCYIGVGGDCCSPENGNRVFYKNPCED